MNERIIERIRKMLALANDAGATEGERDNAMRMAHATLAKYNLDIAMIEASGTKKAKGEERTKEVGTFYGRPWARNVCVSVAKLMFSEYVYVSAKRATDTGHYFIGRHSNAITATELARFVVESILREAKRHERSHGGGWATVRAFAWGAARRIGERVEEIRADAEKEPVTVPTGGTALVLASVYAIEAEQNALAVATYFPTLRTGRSGKGVYDSDAYGAGKAYGGSISLNPQLK